MPLCNNLLLLQTAVRPNELKNIPTENIKRICYFPIQLNKTTDIAKMDMKIKAQLRGPFGPYRSKMAFKGMIRSSLFK